MKGKLNATTDDDIFTKNEAAPGTCGWKGEIKVTRLKDANAIDMRRGCQTGFTIVFPGELCSRRMILQLTDIKSSKRLVLTSRSCGDHFQELNTPRLRLSLVPHPYLWDTKSVR
jgi:hypothetical protein